VLTGDGLWSGESGLWLWLIAAAVAGWLLWWALIGRRQDRAERGRGSGTRPRRDQ
jgi:hypothetical protein